VQSAVEVQRLLGAVRSVQVLVMGRDQAEIVRKHTYPLYTVFDGKHGIDGSSVLVASAEKFYLLTARHVGIESGRTKLFGDGEQPLFDDFLTLPESIDVSIATIQRPEFFIDNGFDFLQLDRWGINIDVRPREVEPQYLVLGYPYTKTRREVVGRKSNPMPFALWTRLYGQEEHNLLQCTSFTHLALQYLPDKLYDEELAEYRQAPDLRGMSGGGIWDTAGQEPVLVGLLIEQRPSAKPLSLIATRIDAISEVLRNIGDASIPMSRRLSAEVNVEQTPAQ